MEFLREGGVGMWLMLGTVLVVSVFAATRRGAARSRTLGAGAAMVLAEGLFSVGINLEAVAANYTKFPNPVEALGTGIGEAANAAWFASLLAVALGAAFVARVRKDAALGA